MSLNTIPNKNYFSKRNILLVGVLALFAIGAFASYTIASAQSPNTTTTTSNGTSSGHPMHNCPNMGSSSTGSTYQPTSSTTG